MIIKWEYIMTDVNYLEEERKKLWVEVVALKKAIHELSTRTPEDLKQAKQNSKEASMYKNRAKSTYEETEKIYTNLSSLLETSQEKLTHLDSQIKGINLAYSNSLSNNNEITKISADIAASLQKYNGNIEQIEKDLEECQSSITQSKNIHEQILKQSENSSNLESKVISTHKNVLELYNQINSLYYEIFGYEEESDSDEQTHVEGLKEKLEKTYNFLSTNFKKLNGEFESLKKDKLQEIDNDYLNRVQLFEELQRHIESLLPGAMSAGLSSAYFKKRKLEQKERDRSDRIFLLALGILTVISLIPFAIGAYLFFQKGFDIQTIIIDTPRIVLATLPLYAPAMWLAYSSNRKSNLSKRLIEEYTHKEALSKTFEGLAKQIGNLGKDEISNNLRVKLLYNMVSMSSENPGALIKGYNKSDHPFMDIIDKSTNLTNALEKLSHFPGIKGIAASLLGKIEEHQEEKINKGLATNSIISDEE